MPYKYIVLKSIWLSLKSTCDKNMFITIEYIEKQENEDVLGMMCFSKLFPSRFQRKFNAKIQAYEKTSFL